MMSDRRFTDNVLTPIFPEHRPALKGGDGGGTSGGMEARVAKLESDVEHVKRTLDDLRADVKATRSDIGAMKVDFGRFDERMKHMPGKGFIFSVGLGLLAAAGGIITLAVRFIPHAG